MHGVNASCAQRLDCGKCLFPPRIAFSCDVIAVAPRLNRNATFILLTNADSIAANHFPDPGHG